MPKVPVSDNVVPFASGAPAGPMPSETDFAMAAATMHAQGRLFDTQPGLKGATSDGSEPITDKDMELFRKGKVPPMKQEVFKGGDEGPININPYPMSRGR